MNNQIQSVDSVVEEIDKVVNKWELEWLSSACLEELTQVLTQRDQAIKEALLESLERLPSKYPEGEPEQAVVWKHDIKDVISKTLDV